MLHIAYAFHQGPASGGAAGVAAVVTRERSRHALESPGTPSSPAVAGGAEREKGAVAGRDYQVANC